MKPAARSYQSARAHAPADFVSRAELKLAGAAAAFHYDFRGKTVLDIGSSTGGFTAYALARGASRVIAVEIGTNQMKAPLRYDSRVDLREKTDIFQLTRLEPVDVILADVSFVSLKSVLRHAKAHFATPQTDFLVMLKPQFETASCNLKQGIVKNERLRRQIIKDFESWLKTNHFVIKNKRDNTLAGKNGNLERFYCLRLAAPSSTR